MPPATKKAGTFEGDGLSEVLVLSTVPSTAAALLLLDGGLTHLVHRDGGRSEAQSGGPNHRFHVRGRSEESQALLHSHFISARRVPSVPAIASLPLSVLSVLSVARVARGSEEELHGHLRAPRVVQLRGRADGAERCPLGGQWKTGH